MRRTLRFALLSIAALVAAAPAFPAARAQDAPEVPKDPGFQFYETAAKRILKAAGAKVWEAAETAKRSGLHQFCYEQAQRALEFDPDLKEAREHLGYVKKSEKWVLDPEAAGKVLKQNQKSEKVSQESFDKLMDKWREEALRPADVFVAAKYADLGDECVAKGFRDQAAKGWEAALRLDKDNAKARKGLGYKKLGKVWLTEKQEQARKDAAKGKELKEDSQWDSFFGSKMNKVESEHFRVESPYGVPELMEYVAAAETAYAYYLADFGMDPTQDVFGGGKSLFVVMQTDDQWNKFVDAYAADKEFTRQLGGTGDGNLMHGIRTNAGSSPAGRKDHIVHQAVHQLNKFVWSIRGSHAWVDEGLAYYYTLKVLESTSTYCVSLKKGNYEKPGDEGGMKKWEDAANWKTKIKDLVRAKNDVPLRTLIYQPITQLEFPATVKAWCLCTWFMDTNRDKWISTLELMKAGSKSEDVLQSVWEKGLEDLEADWQKWALKTY
jgi:tetratricopeptide (TPR) repeat protein